MSDDNSFLGSLAQGLRGAAGVLNPDIQRQNAQQDFYTQQRRDEQRQSMIEQTIRGIENGSIDPTQGQATLQRLGYAGGNVGISPHANLQQEEIKQKKALGERDQLRDAVLSDPNNYVGGQIGGQLTPQATQKLYSLDPMLLRNKVEQQGKPIASGSLIPDSTSPTGYKSADPTNLGKKPLFENNFPIGKDMVQPHVSFDNGVTWKPVEGSQPTHKFSSQVINVNTSANTGSPTSEGDRQANAARIAAGEPLAQVIPGFGAAYMKERNNARHDAIQLLKEQNPGMTDAQAGLAITNAGLDYAGGKKSIGQLTTMYGATKQAVKQLDFNVDKTTEVMKKLGSTDISPILNAVARGEEKWTGKPEYSSLFYYLSGSAIEAARIRSGGQASQAQLHQGAMDEAKSWASINMTPASWAAVADAMKAEGLAKLGTYKDSIDEQRLGGGTNKPSDPAAPAAASPGGVKQDPLGIR